MSGALKTEQKKKLKIIKSSNFGKMVREVSECRQGERDGQSG